MTTGAFFLSAWDWEPSIVVGCAVLGLAAILFRERPWQTLTFLAGVLLLLVDLVSPIDTLGDVYLFSAHVLQHFLLALVIPALFVLGTPRKFAASLSRWDRIPALLAWALGVGTMIVWHVPVLFNAALANDALHIAQHLSFLVTGTIFWWPILHPIEARRVPPLGAVAYLFSACTFCSILGAVLTFMPLGLYPAYLSPKDEFGILHLVRDTWGLDPKSDQQLGGLLMWVPSCLVYLSAILATAARWFSATKEAQA
jgi:cytochrome c oxidase assembly factor CtaG